MFQKPVNIGLLDCCSFALSAKLCVRLRPRPRMHLPLRLSLRVRVRMRACK